MSKSNPFILWCYDILLLDFSIKICYTEANLKGVYMWGVPFVAKKVKKDKLYEKVKAGRIKTTESTPKEAVDYPFEVGARVVHSTFGEGLVNSYINLDTVSCLFTKAKRDIPVSELQLIGGV